MSILNKYKRWVPMLIPINDEYWDFVLSQDGSPSSDRGAVLNEKCLSSYIAFWDAECQEPRGVHSYEKYYWDGAKNNGSTLEHIGYTGIDNGLIYYGGFDNISNREFYEIFTNSKIEIPANDKLLHLRRVTGNTGVYSYESEYESGKYWALKGGFFQGFFKLFGHEYEILPHHIDDEWNVEITLRPMGYITDDKALNNTHPENSGIFFYIGTRAEDKFLQITNGDVSKYEEREQPERHKPECDYFIEKVEKSNEEYYFSDEYAGGDIDVPSDYYTPCPGENKPKKKDNKKKEDDKKAINRTKAKYFAYFLNVYGYRQYSMCGCGGHPSKEDDDVTNLPDICDKSYLADSDGYYEKDLVLSGMTLYTKDGKPLSDNGYYEIKTDNKFLLFNRTKYGFTTANWDDGVEVLLTGSTNDLRNGNLFLLMNRTKSGYTTNTIDSYFSENRKEYDFVSSLKGNAFALKYNEDGSIGYRYLVRDCDSDEGYSVIEEKSLPGMIKPEEWSTVNIKFNIINGSLDRCGNPSSGRKMKIRIYVNGYLKFVSKVLPEFDLRELSTISEKQEGVPFNISVGGGTQGLCDSVWLDYNKAFEKILPIEKNFAGTFIGDIYDFKFYTCPNQFSDIANNYMYVKAQMREKKVFI